MKSILRKIKWNTIKFLRRKKLKNFNFSIISDNCWGGFVYQHSDLPYSSPFAGLFIFSEDYIKLLQNLKEYMRLDLKFIAHSESKYIDEIIKCNTLDTYPIALLGDVEIHFLHYPSKEEAESKWTRRKNRINYDNLIIKMCDRDLFSKDMLNEFSHLPFKKKVFLSSTDHSYDYCIKLKNESGIMIENEWDNFIETVDLIKLLNKTNWDSMEDVLKK